MTPIASFSPGNRGLLPFGTCRLGGPPRSSLIGTDSCVDVRLGQGSVVGVTDLEFLGAEPVLCTVLQVYIGALSWDASFFIRPLPDLLGSHCAEMIETHGLGATHRDRCKSSSPLEPEHWVCASDSGGPPCRFQGTGLRMTARLAPPQSIFTRSWLPSHPVEVWEAIGRFEGLFWPSGFKHCNGGLRCTSVAQGCTPIACKPCKLTEVSVTNLSWDLLSLRALLICVVFGAGIALAARCSAIILEVSLTWFGRSIRPAWATRAPNNGPDTSWRIFGFILGFATVLTRLHPTVVGAHSIMTCQRRLLSDLETYVVSLSLTLGLVVLGQLLALLMRALGFHRTPGGRCILWCDTSHVALILCSLAAASCVDSSPLLWRVCISDAACLGRYRRQRRHATGAQSSSYSVLWRPVPAATSLAGFTRGTPHYNRHDPGVALPEALGPGLGARRLPSQHWTCKCFRGFVSRDALAEGCHDPTSAFPDAAAAPAPNNTEIEAVASRGIVPCVPCLVHKLDQEPASLTLEGRTTLERLRDMPGPAAGTWPTVPATDDSALQRAVEHTVADASEEGQLLSVGLLSIGFDIEEVALTLTAPTTIEELCAQVALHRDPVQGRVLPLLRAVEPQPSNTYCLLFALPGWAASEHVACFDLSEVDGRVYAENVPLVASRRALLRLAALPPDSAVDIYIGSSAVPVEAEGEFDLQQWTCLFFVPSFELPGPYFWLQDTLLTSVSWMPEVVFPSGPELPCACLVHDSGHRFLNFGAEDDFGRVDVIAESFRLKP